MKNNVREIKITYKSKEIIPELDQLFEKALEPWGFHRWASGYGYGNQERDLAFDKRNP